jgi:pimeloyl-ACP methyl ester carboxylesterase
VERSKALKRRSLQMSAAVVVPIVMLAGACGGADVSREKTNQNTRAQDEPERLDRVVRITKDRGLYVRCSGTGSPTVVMEGGDEDTSDSYRFAEGEIGDLTRTCVYDRANLGLSDPAPGPRGLADLVSDLERLLEAADLPGPYVLVGTSGGGFITAGYAVTHPGQVAGMVFIDTGAPLSNPPREIVEATSPGNPENIERRDYLQVERDAWAARKRIGNIPVTVVSVDFSRAEENASPFAVERRAMERNVQRQRGWLVLSSRAKQVVVHGGHAVEEANPDLVIRVIREVVEAAR